MSGKNKKAKYVYVPKKPAIKVKVSTRRIRGTSRSRSKSKGSRRTRSKSVPTIRIHKGTGYGNGNMSNPLIHSRPLQINRMAPTSINRPQYIGGMVKQPYRAKEVITAWDLCLAAKKNPGKTDPPFVAGMNNTTLPSIPLNVSNAFAECGVF